MLGGIALTTPLTPLQKDVIVGTMLGDASMERDKPTHNYRIRFDLSYQVHESYTRSLYEIFKDLTGTPPEIRTRKPDKRTGKVYQTIAFYTRRVVALNYFFL